MTPHTPLPDIPPTVDAAAPPDHFVAAIDVHTLLPQQKPFVMVGRLTHYDHQRTVTETTVSPDNILADDGTLSPAGMAENIAQTCAARIGYINRYILRQDIAAGVIAAITGMKIVRRPQAGETLRTTLDIEAEAFGMIMASATIAVDGSTIAETRIKLKV